MPSDEYEDEQPIGTMENLVVRRTNGVTTEMLVAKILMVADQLSGGRLYPYQREFAGRIIEAVLERESEEITSLFSRQCLGPDQIVTQRDGSLTRMVASERSWQTKKKAPVFSLRMAGGACIDEVTKEHVFFTRSGERALKDLSVGDEIAIVTRIDAWKGGETLRGTTTHKNKHRSWAVEKSFAWTPELALLLGYMSSDGYCALDCGQAAKFTNIDPAYLADFDRVVRAVLPGVKTLWRPKGKGFDIYPYSGKRTAEPSLFKALLRVADFDHGFPRAIADTTPELAAAYLRGVLHGDGCIQPSRASMEVSVGCDLVYGRYLQALLLKLGVRSSITKEWMAKSTRPFHRLLVAGAENCLRLTQHVGVLGGHKESAHKALLESFSAQLAGLGKGNAVRCMYPTVEYGQDGEHIAYAKIHAIDPAGTADVYDREEPGKGWFVCQGIKTHNSGKSQTIAAIVGALMLVLPMLAVELPNDDRFCYKDPKSGAIRSYVDGFWIGVFAPKKEQAGIIFSRVKAFFRKPVAQQVMREMGVTFDANNSDTCRISNGSSIRCSTASDQSHIEGSTLHLGVLEESQDIGDEKVNKSIRPMMAATGGCIVKIGTANAKKSHFLVSIRRNERRRNQGAKQNHFFADYMEAAKYNSFYAQFVEKEKMRLGERSDEFQMSYACLADGSPVWMANGTLKPIEAVCRGDKIITESGQTAVVTHTRRKKSDRSCVALRVNGVQDLLTLTHDHRMLTQRGWVEAGMLERGDYLLSPAGAKGNRTTLEAGFLFGNKATALAKGRCQNTIALTEAFMGMVGLFVADGSTNRANLSQINWAFGLSDNALAQTVYAAADELGIPRTTYSKGSVQCVSVNAQWLSRILRRDCGEDCYTKRVPSWVFECPEHLIRAFVEGYFSGDGCYSPSTLTCKASSVSKLLTQQVGRLLEMCSVQPAYRALALAGTAVIEGRTVNTADSFEVAAYSCDSESPFSQVAGYRHPPRVVDGFVRRRVREVTPVPYNGYVNDITVGGDEPSFLTLWGVAHNCRFILERGMAVSDAMFHNRCVLEGPFSDILPGPRKGMHYVAGIDFGKMHDSTVVTILEVNWENPRQVLKGYDEAEGAFTLEIYGKHICGWLEMLGDDYEAQYHEISRFLKGWNIERAALDYTGVGIGVGDRIRAHFDGADLQMVEFSSQSKDQICRQLLADLHTGMITWPAGEECQERREWRDFRVQMLDLEKEYRNGMLDLRAPEIRGAHDDYPMALCLAIHAAICKPFGGEVEESNEVLYRGKAVRRY